MTEPTASEHRRAARPEERSERGGEPTLKVDPGPLATVHAEDTTLVFVRNLRQSPERVWAALTEPDRVCAWAPYEVDRDLGTPGPATLTMIDGDTRTPLDGTVHRAERPTVLEHAFGTDRLRWDLEPVDDGTRLTLRHTVDDPDLLPKVAAGWHLCLVVAQRLLDGDPIPVIRGQAAMSYGWQELNDAYQKELG